MESPSSVVYVLPDMQGGALNIVRGLLAFRQPDSLAYDAVLTRNRCDTRPPPGETLLARTQTSFEYALPVENLYAVLRRLNAALPAGPGVLVANDLLELALLHVHDAGRTVVQLLHGDTDYYYDLATRHEAVIDVFVAYSCRMAEMLRRRLPHRAADVRHLPYGIALPPRTRNRVDGALRLLFFGRLEHFQKGVFDLPDIDRLLRDRGVDVRWTVIGDGPDGDTLRARWTSDRVTFLGWRSHGEALAAAVGHDVFVLPTRFEGFPMSLLETMGTGLVPVVSAIPSGVPEVVEHGTNGMLAPVGDVAAFAEAIAVLARDRARLDAMGQAARARVEQCYDIRVRVRGYQDLYANWKALRRPRGHVPPLPYGSRLDRPWVPNALVCALRAPIFRRRPRAASPHGDDADASGHAADGRR